MVAEPGLPPVKAQVSPTEVVVTEDVAVLVPDHVHTGGHIADFEVAEVVVVGLALEAGLAVWLGVDSWNRDAVEVVGGHILHAQLVAGAAAAVAVPDVAGGTAAVAVPDVAGGGAAVAVPGVAGVTVAVVARIACNRFGQPAVQERIGRAQNLAGHMGFVLVHEAM